ncbi:hypothetical protein AQ505_10080 [Pedobacter sp. PACM 27299]|uniref:hypothetical protein n=1 Tax=Pedobacter sp. PACM 27299 TaxID=1727164 RepID=UPI000706DE4E|nr:hypothetical protein [Pedobacter sp. PACM 27299]ALL05808.1 hypothetical protein AQ505_10080 [Pedobacter sp. PACM 27299]
MQYHLEISLPADFSIRDREKAILELLEANKEPLALMLQGYHTKEKVRHVLLTADSLMLDGAGKGSVTAVYQLEEYNVCSAIDRIDMESMILSFLIDELRNTLKVSGVFIPEREPDSF